MTGSEHLQAPAPEPGSLFAACGSLVLVLVLLLVQRVLCGLLLHVNSYCLGSTREGADAVTRQHWISSEEGLECRDIHFALKGKSRDLFALNCFMQ